MAAVIRHHGWLVTALACSLALWGCGSDKIRKTEFGIQQNLFLQSLELVEKAGSQLQSSQMSQEHIDAALSGMDSGLRQAFQVDERFLAELHKRLPEMYNKRFIKGVEEYRLGVTLSDRQQQLRGLDKLTQWSRFWSREKSGILQKMAAVTGLPVIDS
jgi:hypothetical protein